VKTAFTPDPSPRGAVKLEFHGTDTDTDTDILADIRADPREVVRYG